MMPGEDGLSLCRHLVETQQLPVIFLTARGEATDRIVGLELGADDYLAKPFEPRELVARIRSVLRRMDRGGQTSTDQADWLYAFEGWQLDPLKRKLVDPEGVTIPISTAEYRLLRAFLDHPRSVLDRDRLLDMIKTIRRKPVALALCAGAFALGIPAVATMLSSVRLALFGLLASGLTACDSSSGSAPGAVSEGEAEALDEIAEELDRNRLPDEAIPQLREADNASTEVTGDSDASTAP